MRQLIQIVLLIALVVLLSLPVMAQDTVVETDWTCPEGYAGQTLNVYNWATYIGENTISDFEALCDVTVNYDTFDTNESLIARLRQGNPGYDVAFPNDYAVIIMAREELIQPIDLDNIPNFKNVAENFQGLSFDPENEYSVPYLWGTTGIGYNVEKAGEIKSLTDLFEYDGPVAWIDDVRAMMALALGVLGYNPSSQDPAELEEAKNYLLDHSDNVVAIADDDGQALLERGEVDMVVEYNGDIYQLQVDCECDMFEYVVPEELSLVDITNLVLLTDAPNPELAQVFMDYILDPAVNGAITSDTGYATANIAAIEGGFVDEELLNSTSIYPDLETMNNIQFYEEVGDAEQIYNDTWDEILILIGA